MVKIGIIREGKNPPDSRVPLSPAGVQRIMAQNKEVSIVVQPSRGRCFSDDDYTSLGIKMEEDLGDCDILLGVKEVPISMLIEQKTYFFFSHTIKEQAYNRALLKAILDKNIHLIDYEVLTDEKGRRLIAFGKFAGMVGAHNGILAYGKRTGKFHLPRMKNLRDYAEAKMLYRQADLPGLVNRHFKNGFSLKVVLSGTGRVAQGAQLVLEDMGFEKVSPKDFQEYDYNYPVYTQLSCKDYVARKDGSVFDKKDFYQNPSLYKSIFEPYFEAADIFINGIYWDNLAPAFFTVEQMRSPEWNIKVIADVTCDIAPVSSIPSTLRASTIADPLFGYDPYTESEVAVHTPGTVDMMTIDNLPNELPRDASEAFGDQFIEHVLPCILEGMDHPVLKRASITDHGELGSNFTYLSEYAGLKKA